jgi:enoyl-CoA hydratase/carnithine racemase
MDPRSATSGRGANADDAVVSLAATSGPLIYVAIGRTPGCVEPPAGRGALFWHFTQSPHAVRASKRLFNETRLGDVAEGFKLEESLQRELIGSPNQIEAVKANLQKRQPNFSDPD